MTKVQKPSVIYENNQCAIFLLKNTQVDISAKHIDIHHHFLRDMVDDKDIGIQYIRSEDNHADIITKNTSESYLARCIKRITKG